MKCLPQTVGTSLLLNQYRQLNWLMHQRILEISTEKCS